MPHYRVWAKRIEFEYLDVEAKDEDEAIRIADDDQGNGFPMWNPTDDIEWEIVPAMTENLEEPC